MSEYEDKLTDYRVKIDDLDSQLVELLVRRRAITAQIGELKSKAGKPVFAPERESAMLHLRRQQALDSGLSPDLIEDVLRRVMRDSYLSQDAGSYHCVNVERKKVVVIGGRGQLGQIFVDLFKRSNYLVKVLESEDWLQSDSLLSDADLVIVAVPIRSTGKIIQQLHNLPKHCILADVTSVKAAPLYEMLKVHAGPVVGLHPMFGPDVTGLVKQTIIVCEGRLPEQYMWLLEQFRVWGAAIYPVSANDHDQAMSMVQVMRHFSTIVYGYHLMTEGADIAQLVEMSSPIYRLELVMVGRLFAQDPVLYTDIIFANPENVAMMKRFAYRFLELLEDVELGDKEEFITMFKQISTWFGDYATVFLEESKAMLAKTHELKKS